jgi:hypothetical protein
VILLVYSPRALGRGQDAIVPGSRITLRAVPANAAENLNGVNRAFDLSIPPDDDGVLTSTAATQVFLMARSRLNMLAD